MLAAQLPQPLPSFNLALPSDHYKTILPNLSYPSRPNAHVPWFGSSAPLLFTNTTRPEMTVAPGTPNAQIPTTANLCFDTGSVPGAFHGISVLIWHNLSMIVRKLRWIKERLFGVRTTSFSVNANV